MSDTTHTHDHDCGCGGHDHQHGEGHGEGRGGHHGRHGHGGCGRGHGHHRFHHGGGHGGFGGPWGAGRGHGGPMRAKRGAVKFGVLLTLAEGPKHGYQIIQDLGEKSGGMWQPSPGSVYPTLEKLEEHGLVASSEEGDKKVYALTDAGREKVERLKEMAPPWAAAAGGAEGVGELRDAMMQLGSAAMQVARSGNEDQRSRAVEVIAKARKALYAILAED